MEKFWTTSMKKSELQGIVVYVTSGLESALAMLMHRDGTVNRQGDGSLPRIRHLVIGMTDGTFFRQAVDLLDERVLDHAGVFDHRDKFGVPLNYKIIFAGDNHVATFSFSLGTESKNVGDILPYLDGYIKRLVLLTDDWYYSNGAPRRNPD
jgi:hypothetical protein